MSIIGKGVIEIDPVVAAGWLATGEALLVDVREDDEWAEERIPGTLLAPMSDFDPETFPTAGERRLVVVCRVGRRSEAIAAKLARLGWSRVYNMAGGLNAWKAADLPLEGDLAESDPWHEPTVLAFAWAM